MINLRLVVENTIIYKNNIVTRPWKFDICEDFNFSHKYLIICDHLLIGHRQVYHL